ncbi:S-adenosyl-L-methionine-dependent methyltransferase, partial [Paraphoma chrysanthemicola]
EIELPEVTLECGSIQPGAVVEMQDHSGRESKRPISGDFLLVRSIVEDLQTGDVVFRGYRMRRCAYLQPMFDGKFNNLFMLLEVSENDARPRFVQGLEDIDPDEVVCRRECTFTNLGYDELNIRHVNKFVPARLKTQEEQLEWLFHQGKLLCRWVHIVEVHPTGKSCGGEARRLYQREVADFSQKGALLHESSLRSSSTPAPQPATPMADKISRPHIHKRTYSVEDLGSGQSKRMCLLPKKIDALTVGDGFCCTGGTSSGAQQAGLKVLWGLEKDRLAMAAYRRNFPGAMALEMDAHDFADIARRCTHGCDHLHMSCPCCFWSAAHTVEGKNDEANILTLFTVEPWLAKLKPGTFSLEQAPGLLRIEKHKMFFRILINGILNKGYGVRWRIQDQAWFGVAQHRPRLIFVGSKTGIPLPPFPAPIHGPPKSGLKRYVTIEDALKPLERQTMSFRDNPYHQPDLEKRMDGTPFDPHINLAKTITTSGGDNVHHSGTRANTVIELSQFQGFPLTHHFTGSNTEAKKQCGNAWSPKASKVYFLLWAAVREAFDHGYIDAEDEVLDLYAFLKNKGITIPKPAPIEIDLFNGTPARAAPASRELQYRYLHRIEETVKPNFPLQLWARRKEIDRLPQRKKKQKEKKKSLCSMRLMSESLEDITESYKSESRRDKTVRNRRAREVLGTDKDKAIVIEDDDDEEENGAIAIEDDSD